MKRNFKRVMAVHDLSGLGRSSLMAATPVLSVMGMQVCPVPTAVLSTQTSGFENYTFVDLTDNMPPYLQHWKELQMDFDCIYSGFLGSVRQIEIMERVLEDFNADGQAFVVVDPVLGDDGALYDTMNMEMVQEMCRLVSHADIITPNMTELKLLLGIPAEKELYAEQLPELLPQMAAKGPRTVVVTGVHRKNGQRCVCCYQREQAEYQEIDYKELPISYPGTGDIFASVLIGAILQGRSLKDSIQLSADFICHAVADAIEAGEPIRDGVQLEKNLYRLVQKP
ncbi:MAG: pyridoxamine kinase [Peptococcaceae bacterium]|nr:pyridoxamine kinase [Peptococcaceae bacterium]